MPHHTNTITVVVKGSLKADLEKGSTGRVVDNLAHCLVPFRYILIVADQKEESSFFFYPPKIALSPSQTMTKGKATEPKTRKTRNGKPTKKRQIYANSQKIAEPKCLIRL